MKALLLGTLLLFGSGISSAFTFISQNMAEFSDADPRRIGHSAHDRVSEKLK